MKTRSAASLDSLADWLRHHAGSVPAQAHGGLAEAHVLWAEQSQRARELRECLATLDILRELKVDAETLIAAAAFPLVLAQPSAAADWGKRHGTQVEALLQGQIEAEKVWPLHAHKSSGSSAEGLRRLLLALVKDLRVVFILLARQLAHLRAVAKSGEEERRRLAQMTADIHAPLANRLGIWQLKWEMEDLTFRFLQPEAYKRIAALLEERREDRERYIHLVKEALRQALAAQGVEAQVAGRPKHIYSIYKKMQRKGVEFSELYDVRAVRLLVRDLPACYAALGVVHNLWTPIPKEFDDYIAKPKGNDYRSLHTAVIGPEGKSLEVQIRTHEMHEHAELGVAAHWRYKEGGASDAEFEKKIAWMRQLLESRDEQEDGGDHALLAGFSTELMEDRVYVLTPKGQVIDMPKNATVLDFAYQVHTEVGHRTRGAKVNGRIVPLTHSPRTGDHIEILTGKSALPKRDWLNTSLGYLTGSRARHKVRQWFNKLDRQQNVRDGRDILEREFKRLALASNGFEAVLPRLHLESVDDLYVAIALGDLTPAQVARVLHEVAEPKKDDVIPLNLPRPGAPSKARDRDAIVIEGVGNLLVNMAACCNPVPGDAIVGFITVGRGVSVHRADCKSLAHLATRHPNRVMQVQWGGRRDDRYPVRIKVSAYDRSGLLRDIGAVLAAEQINVSSVDSRIDDGGIAELSILVRVSDYGQLSQVLGKLRGVASVIEASRIS